MGMIERGVYSNVVIVLGGGILQVPLIQEIKNRDWFVIVIDKNSEAVAKSIAHLFLNISIKDTDKIVDTIIKQNIQVNYVLTAGTDVSFYVAKVSQALNIPSITVEQAIVTTYKDEMRSFLQKIGLKQPKMFSSTSKLDTEKWVHTFVQHQGFVIKPTNNMGARGVIFIKDIEDLSFAYELAQRESSIQQTIIEEYIEGDEISVDALVYDGVCYLTGVADRIIEKKDGRYFVEYGHTMPTKYDEGTIHKILVTMQMVANGLSSLNHGKPYHGVLKGDLKINLDGDVIINEVASRLSGGFMSAKTFPYATDINLMSLYLDLVTQNKERFLTIISTLRYHRVCIERAIVAKPGVIQEYRVEKEAYTIATEIIINAKVGDIVYDLKSNIGKCGHIIIVAPTLEQANNKWNEVQSFITLNTIIPEYNHRVFIKEARLKFNNTACWVCKECDGMNCASGVPGMGAVGSMKSFQNNSIELAKIELLPNYINRELYQYQKPNLSTSVMGFSIAAPLLTAPITGSISNMGGSISEWDYAYESGMAAKNLGLIPTFGDGATEDKYLIGLKAIQSLGVGFPVFKPRTSMQDVFHRVEKAISMGSKAFGMDIDGLSFKTMYNKNQATSRKSLKDLHHLATQFSVPFFVKGVMTIEDAKIVCEAGVAAIIVSNHGGRVLDSMPGTAKVLPSIVSFVKEHYPSVDILVDGGIRSGVDIFKMLQLGAKAVLVGRPIVISAIHSERVGVQSLLESYIQDLSRTMDLHGFLYIKNIDSTKVILSL